MKVLYTANYRSFDIMNEFIFLEVDQVIYAEVLDAMFKMGAEGFEVVKWHIFEINVAMSSKTPFLLLFLINYQQS